ncbi:phosphate signaling complex protein PhoU [Natranaerobius thermophilus]|uniref:Phosphate-specific transport system accessory protein PhoU n=1 Tax=Natranaerobius thermophilus (strain ATCC BAA-1301 / DSM 18059 / JW/NM-WN-LF) TaxID=457570 RepID=B2A0K6_NATTJ|nr:phosphate signaling complex protein PhoU [Natranaerobius thermophilus]ACB84567.1 phosphate uptake regulator, PhoU [Natranaerobius thermophilus JW/NM-WN-LF]
MVRDTFDQELTELKNQVLVMGGAVEKAISKSIEGLKKQDGKIARQVIQEDDSIDDLELEIEDKCLTLIARHQPMAKDLRRIGIILKLITDLERMGDKAASISHKTLNLLDEPFIKPLVDIPRMADLTEEMVENSLNAFVKENVDLAYQVIDDDNKIDYLYDQIFRELVTYMITDPKKISQATQLMFVSSDLERISDHATNLGEWVIFMVTGDRIDV